MVDKWLSVIYNVFEINENPNGKTPMFQIEMSPFDTGEIDLYDDYHEFTKEEIDSMWNEADRFISGEEFEDLDLNLI
jgi:hypothetical protein